jgi:ParB-like chromosome segregation protein Spo0J
MKTVRVDEIWARLGVFSLDEILALADSLATDGQRQPVIVRRLKDGTLELLDGHRRLLAARLLEATGRTIAGLTPGTIQAVDVSELPYNKAVEVEAAIDLISPDWRTVVTAVERLHCARLASDHTWTASKTDELVSRLTGLRRRTTRTKQRLALARYLHLVEAEPSERAALRKLSRILRKEDSE